MKRRQIAALGIMVVMVSTVTAPVFSEDVLKPSGAPRAKKVESGVSITPQQRAETDKKFGKLPLAFEINQGQTDASVRFLSRQANSTLYLTSHEAVIDVVRRDGPKDKAQPSLNGAQVKDELPKIPVSSLMRADA